MGKNSYNHISIEHRRAIETGSGTLMFANSPHPVGGDGTVPGTTSSSAADCHLGAGGLLTDPDDDARLWYWGHVYADGSLEITASSTPDAAKTLTASGRLCTMGKYNALGAIPWYDYRSAITSIAIKADMATFADMRLNYTFYGMRQATGIVGMQYVRGLKSMRYCFGYCTVLATLDLRGLDTSALADLYYAFAGCSALVTILADSTWALPSGAAGSGCFYSCSAIVGGAGTTYVNTTTGMGITYCRIDGGTASPGYLTAG